MKNHIRNSKNGYLQGLVFIANLCLKEFRYLVSRRRASQFCRYHNIHLLKKYKTSDTLFILGSGSSISAYTQAQFNHIANHDSVGFNFWLLHEFVPTFYTAEFIPKSSRSEALWYNLDRRKEDYKNTHIIYKYSQAFKDQISLMPRGLKRKYLTSQLNIPGMSGRSIQRWFTVLDALGFFSPNSRSQCMLYRQASLSWFLSLALRLEYQNVVLCGVDLNSTDYFFDLHKETFHVFPYLFLALNF